MMASHSTIEWTEATWNPIAGCSIVSPGCINCYAMKRVAPRLAGNPATPHYAGTVEVSKRGPVWTGRINVASERVLTAPLRWKRPRMIFVNSTSDLFHEDVPDAVIDRVFAVMALCPQHTFQVLTKRGKRMREYVTGFPARRAMLGCDSQLDWIDWPLPNVWLGVSAERQQEADERVPELLGTPAAIRFVSAEPLLGPIDFYKTSAVMPAEGHPWRNGPILQGIDWVIVGGESGPDARPMHPDWARSIRDQCARAGVPFFFKQWGNHRVVYDRDIDDPHWRKCGSVQRNNLDGRWLNLAGGNGFHGERVVYAVPARKKAAGRLLDGIEHNGMPQPREVPAL